jgi:hypothetical protein
MLSAHSWVRHSIVSITTYLIPISGTASDVWVFLVSFLCSFFLVLVHFCYCVSHIVTPKTNCRWSTDYPSDMWRLHVKHTWFRTVYCEQRQHSKPRTTRLRHAGMHLLFLLKVSVGPPSPVSFTGSQDWLASGQGSRGLQVEKRQYEADQRAKTQKDG